MKVLMINSVCGIRSTGRICTDLAEELEKQGHECKIAYGRETVPEKYKKYAVRIGNSFSVKIDALKTRLFDNAGFNSKRATKKFIKLVEKYNPDVIHLHNLHGYYINIEVLFDYIKKTGKKAIWTLHDEWSFTGHCAVLGVCEKWKEGCLNCVKNKAYPSSFVNKSKKNYLKKKELFTGVEDITLITPSKWLADLVKDSFLAKYYVKVINNGIDVSIFKPTESNFRERFNLLDKKIVLGVASAWGKGKGIQDFLKLSKVLQDNYKIVLVGVTEEQKKHLPKDILAISRTSNVKELVEIYSTANVFVNPTYIDNYPTVNLEAQCCGTSVITYNTGGSVESVPQEYVVEQGNVDKLAEMIVKVCKHVKAKVLNLESFDKKSMIREYLKVYKFN